jgi:hypothetical protein
LESNDHPEINSSKFLGEDDIQKYQSLIGAMQWAISIGHFDIAVHVMTMYSFRASDSLANPLRIIHNLLWNQTIIQKSTPPSFLVKTTFRSISL